jgi:hypothetical protein
MNCEKHETVSQFRNSLPINSFQGKSPFAVFLRKPHREFFSHVKLRIKNEKPKAHTKPAMLAKNCLDPIPPLRPSRTSREAHLGLRFGCWLLDVRCRMFPPSQLLPKQQVPAYSSRCGGGVSRRPNLSTFSVRCSPSPFRVPSSALRVPPSCLVVPDRARSCDFHRPPSPNHMKPPLDGTPVFNLISPARWTAETMARPNIFSDLMRLTERFVL